MAWIAEANVPFPPADLYYFSPLIRIAGEFIMYCVHYTNVAGALWGYNQSTKVWAGLAAPPGGILVRPQGSLALSPDESMLCARPRESNVLHIYNIGTNNWVTSAACPNQFGFPAVLRGIVWETNDTIWAFARYNVAPSPNIRVMASRYQVSLNAWTQFANFMLVNSNIPQGTSISTDGSTLYAAWGGISDIKRYVIATDIYTAFNAGAGPAAYSDDKKARIWWYDAGFITRYFDCDTETNSDPMVIDNPSRTKIIDIPYAIDNNMEMIIAGHDTVNPANWSEDMQHSPYVQTDPATGVT